MKLFAVTILLALLLAGCASSQGGSGGSGGNYGASWECHKIQAGGWGSAAGSPCS
jgi:hypothetical protein